MKNRATLELDAIALSSGAGAVDVGLPQEQLPAKLALRQLGDLHLVVLAEVALTGFGGDFESVLLHRQVDLGLVDAGQVELEPELIPVPLGLPRRRRAGGLTQHLLRHLIQLTKWVEPRQHRRSPDRVAHRRLARSVRAVIELAP